MPRSEIDVVVRHSQHGGMLAAVTGDLFRWPGRAPWELEVSRRLRHAEVATPEVVAYLVYPAGPLFCRNDVATRRLPDGEDLPAAWRHAPPAEREALRGQGFGFYDWGADAARFVTAWNTREEDARALATAIAAL